MMLPKNPPPPPVAPPPRGTTTPPADTFDVDLRDALAHTNVRELSFEEFRRALIQQGRLKPQ